MKMKFVRNGRTGRRELLVASQRGETLDKKRATRLAEDNSTLLLGFAFEEQRGGAGALLHYDVEGLWSLRTYLSKRPMGQDELLGLMRALMGALDLCAERRMPVEGLLLDPEYVFVDAQCCPHFALLPFEDLPFHTRNSPLTLLAAMGDTGRLRFASPDAEGVSRRIGSFVVDQGGVFSINTFRRFLDDEEAQAGLAGAAPEARHSVVEGREGGSIWASVGAAAPRGVADGESMFWSPLASAFDFAAQEETAGAAAVQPAPQPAVQPAPVPQPAPTPAATPALQVTTAAPRSVSTPQPAAVPVSTPVAPVQPAPAPAPTVWRATLVRLATGEEYPLPVGRQVRLGRGSACDIRLLGNPRLSRVHAALVCDGQGVQVTDLGAANGVWANGARLLPQQTALLQAGQPLRLATEEFLVRIEGV